MPTITPVSRRLPEVLSASHKRQAFNSGNAELDSYIKQRASQDAARGVAVTYVIVNDDGEVMAFYTLSSHAIRIKELPPALARKLPHHDLMPATLLGRLAVDTRYKRKGLGGLMIAHALLNAFHNNPAGSIAVVVDPTDQDAVDFYGAHEFKKLPDNDRTMFIVRESLRKFLK